MGGNVSVDERALFVRGPVVVFKWVNAPGWPVEYVSANAEEVFGHTADDFLSGRVAYASTIHADDLERVGEEVRVASEGGQASFVHTPYRMRHQDGSLRHLQDVTQVLRDEDGNATHFLGYVVDISERIAAEQEKDRLQAQLLHSQKLESLGVLAGGVAHDFNNLLTGIVGETTLALRLLGGDAPDVVERLEQVKLLAQRATDLTRQLLAYSGKGRFVVEPIDLARATHDIVKLLDSFASKKAEFLVEVEGEANVLGDRTQLQQILMNLLTNAGDSLQGQQGQVRVNISHQDLPQGHNDTIPALAPGNYVLLVVEDTGCGMAPDTQRQIFEPFFSTKAKGRGLGLAAALGILKGHGGGLLIESSVGVGSKFSVWFPATEQRERVRENEAASAPTAYQGSALIVDDEPFIRSLVQRVLESLGFSVVLAANGLEAIDLARAAATPFAFAMLDMSMPVMDGVETLNALREHDPRLPVIMTSGYDETQTLARLDGRNIAGFLQKPYQLEEFEALIAKALKPVHQASTQPQPH